MLTFFRRVALVEGITNAVLFFVAMPAKYVLGNPTLMPTIGMAHGIAWLIYTAAMVVVFSRQSLPAVAWLRTFLAGLIPLGTFFNDRYLRTLAGRPACRIPEVTP